MAVHLPDRYTFYSFLGRVGCGHIGHRMGGIISAVSNGGSVWEEASGVKSFGSKGMSERPSVRRLLFRSLNAVVLHSTETLQRAEVNGARASVFPNALNGS